MGFSAASYPPDKVRFKPATTISYCYSAHPLQFCTHFMHPYVYWLILVLLVGGRYGIVGPSWGLPWWFFVLLQREARRGDVCLGGGSGDG